MHSKNHKKTTAPFIQKNDGPFLNSGTYRIQRCLRFKNEAALLADLYFSTMKLGMLEVYFLPMMVLKHHHRQNKGELPDGTLFKRGDIAE